LVVKNYPEETLQRIIQISKKFIELLISMSAYKCSEQIAKRVPCIIYSQYQRHCGTSRVGWLKFKDFAIKFGTIIFTNSKSPKIFQQNIKISKYLTIWKSGGPGHNARSQ